MKPNLDKPLHGLRVGISGAIPQREHWSAPAQDRDILEFVSLLSGLVIKYGGEIVHGGHPTFTPVILRQAAIHRASKPMEAATIFMSELWAKDLSLADREFITRSARLKIISQYGIGTPNDPEVRNGSLTLMRTMMIAHIDLLVVIGGVNHEKSAFTPGIDEEYALAKSAGLPRFLLDGFGGATERLASTIDTASLGNTLNDSLNHELLTSRDLSFCAGILLRHFCTNRDSI